MHHAFGIATMLNVEFFIAFNLVKNGFLFLSIYWLLADKDDVELLVFFSSRLLSMLDRYFNFIIIPSIECFSIYILSNQNLVYFFPSHHLLLWNSFVECRTNMKGRKNWMWEKRKFLEIQNGRIIRLKDERNK